MVPPSTSMSALSARKMRETLVPIGIVPTFFIAKFLASFYASHFRMSSPTLTYSRTATYHVRMRSYGQSCALAKALDVIGDRWTLLIVRELLIRDSCRYTDLQNGHPAIATNLLAERLCEL